LNFSGKKTASAFSLRSVGSRVARFFNDTMYQKGEKYAKLPLNYQIATKYTK
jgi:hypothetical protein